MVEKLSIKAKLQIAKRPEEVFEAIVDPDQMRNYFIEWGSAVMKEANTVQWKFPESGEKFNVQVHRLIPHRHITFSWGEDENATNVEIDIQPANGNSSVVTVMENEKELDENGIAWLKGNTEGWANFLACLKAWMEYRINLRKGAFDFMRAKHE